MPRKKSTPLPPFPDLPLLPPSPDDRIRVFVARIEAATNIADAKRELLSDALVHRSSGDMSCRDIVARCGYADACEDLHLVCHDLLVLKARGPS